MIVLQADPGSLVAGIASDPISAVLLVLGAVITAGSVGAIGLLALGAVLDALTPETTGRTPGRGG